MIRPKLSLVVAVSRQGVIGREQKLPWDLPADLKRFKEITYGSPIIMGRKTYLSIGRLLPGRKNIILSRDPGFFVPGAFHAKSLEEALSLAGEVPEIFVIGGGEIYRLALEQADRLYVTEVDVEIEGDATFPRWPELKNSPHYQCRSCEEQTAEPDQGRPSFRFLVFERKA